MPLISSGVGGCEHLAPGSHVSVTHFAHALTQPDAGKKLLKLSMVDILLTA